MSSDVCSHFERKTHDREAITAIFKEASVVANLNRDLLSSLENISFESLEDRELVEVLLSAHKKFPDAHFSLEIHGAKGRFRMPSPVCLVKEKAGEFDAACFDARRVRQYTTVGGGCLLKAFPDVAEKILRDHEGVFRALREEKQSDPNQEGSSREVGNALWVRLPRMPGIASPAEVEILDKISFSKLNKGVIFDLRGNSGGSDDLVFSIAKELRPKAHRPYQTYHTKKIVSVRAMEGYVASLRRIVSDYPNAGYADLLIKCEGELDQARHKNLPLQIEVQDWTSEITSEFDFEPPKVAILVDGGCASACEIFVSIFRNDPNVRIVGWPTMGRFLYGNPISFDVPGRGLTVRPTSVANVFKKTGEEMFGLTPHHISLDRAEQEALAMKWVES